MEFQRQNTGYFNRFFELYTCSAEKEVVVLVNNGTQLINITKKINLTEVDSELFNQTKYQQHLEGLSHRDEAENELLQRLCTDC